MLKAKPEEWVTILPVLGISAGELKGIARVVDDVMQANRLIAEATHRHVWRWTSDKAVDCMPPADATCACGATYGAGR